MVSWLTNLDFVNWVTFYSVWDPQKISIPNLRAFTSKYAKRALINIKKFRLGGVRKGM
jgi:hypothetical protein